MKKNCVVYLVRTSDEDVILLNKSLSLIDENLLETTNNTDVVIFHEESFNNRKKDVTSLKNANLIFQLVEFPTPPADAPEIFPHPNQYQVSIGNLGFTMGYRHMCWFFTGGLFQQPIMDYYKYCLRLDNDSFILSKIPYDIFELMQSKNAKYGYIEEGIQKDDPAVIEGLWEFAHGHISNIEEGLMYYTNFEICEIEWFQKGLYYLFFKRIEHSGNIYRKRWGDAPLRYLGVNILMPQTWKLPVRGFVYQHGAIYDLTK